MTKARISNDDRVRLTRVHALRLFYVEKMTAPDIAKKLKVHVDTARRYIDEGTAEAEKRIDATVLNMVRDSVSEEHWDCIKALRQERDVGGPSDKDGGSRGIAGTCRAIAKHLDSLVHLYGAAARPSAVGIIADMEDSVESRKAAKIAILALLLEGKITPASATAANNIIDSIDGSKGDPYGNAGEAILGALTE